MQSGYSFKNGSARAITPLESDCLVVPVIQVRVPEIRGENFMHVPTLVAPLAIVVVASAIFGYIAQRHGLVAIVGYIVAGILILEKPLPLVVVQ